MTADLQAGIWRHYRGGLYQTLGLGHDANADGDPRGQWTIADGNGDPLEEREVVVYIGLTLDEAHLGARLAVRTREDWDAAVCGKPDCERYGEILPDDAGTLAADDAPAPTLRCYWSHTRPRFGYLGPVLTKEMLA